LKENKALKMKLEKIKRDGNILSLGLEAEGGWITSPDASIHTDTSVHVNSYYVGEIKTPKNLRFNFYKCIEYIYNSYPVVVDSSCGFHIHIGTTDANYMLLMETKKLQKEFLNNWLVWSESPFNKAVYETRTDYRLQGNNSYCSKVWRPLLQIKGLGYYQARYSLFNFSYRKHQTLECRAFSMPTSPRAMTILVLRYLTFLNNFIESLEGYTRVDTLKI